ncbi:MAG: ribonuclease HI [Candidatus Egerieousia sp.]|jgi:ribonuclease HI|nr:ribonuclease HI [Bacteroidales bacterium]MCI6918701.1 ribonuclease HI [bacterium]MDY2649695.1 ribonuclease HI [Candidatus Egerieousia sp.]MDD5962627.1 ribonuclease HI [bacterium]MDD7072529.1 ribonuclease HI [bacterium]
MITEPILLYTDGSSRGNPGPGGYGVVLKYGSYRKELSQGFRLTTNNRMELLGVIEGLKAIKKREIPVKIYSDSSYVVNAVNNGWLKSWVSKDLSKKKNSDLWGLFLNVSQTFSSLEFIWIKGHAGHPENERCDRLAVEASQRGDIIDDKGYLQMEK